MHRSDTVIFWLHFHDFWNGVRATMLHRRTWDVLLDMEHKIDCEVSRNRVALHSEVCYSGSQVIFLAYSLWKPVDGAV